MDYEDPPWMWMVCRMFAWFGLWDIEGLAHGCEEADGSGWA